MKAKIRKKKIEINEQFQRALDIMESTQKNVFITGRAGTGKSTLLDYFRYITKKKIVVLAPTGVAALNVKGQTIHSFFKFKPDITIEKAKNIWLEEDELAIYKELDAIVIDEISMVRADLLDCIDIFLRRYGLKKDKPFGGIQMIFIGDLYQLPPVVKGDEKEIFSTVYQSPYFFSAHVFHDLEPEFIELEKIYRQHDEDFINILNKIRNNSVIDEELEIINQRCIPEYEPPLDDFFIHMTTTNELAERINNNQLDRLKGDLYLFHGRIEGNFSKESLPTAIDLKLKVGAQIMLLNNDAGGRWVNGSVGKIMAIKQSKKGNETEILARLADDKIVQITPYTWEIFRFYIEDGKVLSEVVGTFQQYPLMLAWAITIHKSQGKTFDKVIIDIGRGTFAHGQLYVALSRCTSLDGIVLKKPVLKQHIWMDREVVNFLTSFQYKKADYNLSVDEKIRLIKSAIEKKSMLEIVYLKPNDEKTKRIIKPVNVAEMEFNNVKFIGVQAFCLKRNDDRVFRVDRILDIREL